MDIEEVAANTPEKIFFESVDPTVGMTAFQARKIAFKLGFAVITSYSIHYTKLYEAAETSSAAAA